MIYEKKHFFEGKAFERRECGGGGGREEADYEETCVRRGTELSGRCRDLMKLRKIVRTRTIERRKAC